MKRTILLICTLFVSLATATAGDLHSDTKELSIDIFRSNPLVKQQIKLIKSKGSSSNMCSYVSVQDGIKAKVLSVQNVPGDQFITVLVTEKFLCTMFNTGDEDEMSDVQNITASVKIHRFPKQNPDGTFSAAHTSELKLLDISGVSISELESGEDY